MLNLQGTNLPLSGGNALAHDNAVVLCRSYNSSKGDKFPEEFYSVNKLDELKKYYKYGAVMFEFNDEYLFKSIMSMINDESDRIVSLGLTDAKELKKVVDL